MTLRTRIAPSPTGDPHVGTAYVALFNYAFARKHGGQFVLRIEDTDRERSSSAERGDDLRGAALARPASGTRAPTCGGPHAPYRQSERSAIYREHAAELLSARARRTAASARASGSTRCASEQKAAKQNFGYDGLCRALAPAEADARATAGEAHVIRLAMPRDGEMRRARPAARRDPLRERAGRRPGAAEERRLPHLPPGERGRRPPDGDHPRDPRRGVDLVAAQARAALRGLRLAAAGLLPPAAAAQRRPARRSRSARTR